MINPDDVCVLCHLTRDQHGDVNHEFSLDGQLISKRPPEPPRQQPPAVRGATDQDVRSAFAALLNILVEKEILTAKDLVVIISADRR